MAAAAVEDAPDVLTAEAVPEDSDPREVIVGLSTTVAFANVLSVVKLAVRPVAFVQPEPTVMFMPETKFTAAHWRKSQYRSTDLRHGE